MLIRLAVAAALIALASAAHADDRALREDAAALFGRLEPPSAAALAARDVELGRAIFWDERLSLDGKTACASCHEARDWGADRRQRSLDARGKLTSRHSQTVFNAMAQASLRWLGDRADGAGQAEGSMTGSMGFASKKDGVAALARHGYAEAFRAAYPDDPEPLSARNYGRALAAYQATLVTPAPFDRFLAGDNRALDAQQKKGLRLFIDTGCATCHSGALFGGELHQKFGMVKDYWTATKSNPADPGRFAVTKQEEDRYVFRVSMLRNIAKTAPYFHDGAVAKLADAVRIMADVQLGQALAAGEVAAIVRFLESLTGPVPAHYAPPGQRAALD